MSKKDFKDSIKYWQDSAFSDLKAADGLFQKKLYPQTLFFCHLSVEKLIKALIIQRLHKRPPFVHDLRRLAVIAKLELDKEKQDVLDELSVFNISGRYPEEKFDFYKIYNRKGIAKKYLNITRDLILCLKKEFQKT